MNPKYQTLNNPLVSTSDYVCDVDTWHFPFCAGNETQS